MEFVQALVLEVVVIIVLTTIFDLLLPNGTLQPFIRLIMGLFVLITLLNPLMELLAPENHLAAWQLKQPDNQREWDNIAERGTELQSLEREKIQKQYSEKITEQITILLQVLELAEILEVGFVWAEDEQKLPQIILICKGIKTEKQEVQIKQLLAGYYGWAEEQIEVEWVGECLDELAKN